MNVHTYNNGVSCCQESITPAALDRYNKYINLHEPFEEMVFDHILKNFDVSTFIDVGSAWGYYSILVKKKIQKARVIGFDPNTKMIENAYNNAKLNDIGPVEFREGGVPDRYRLFSIIDEVGDIDLLKIDIQGRADKALNSAENNISRIKNIIVGTHGKEHDICINIFKKHNFKIKMNYRADEIPIQPDGLIWVTR